VLVVCLTSAVPCVSLAELFSNFAGAVTCMAASIFFAYLSGATYWAIVEETVPSEHMGGGKRVCASHRKLRRARGELYLLAKSHGWQAKEIAIRCKRLERFLAFL
jgi:hypothetical protein